MMPRKNRAASRGLPGCFAAQRRLAQDDRQTVKPVSFLVTAENATLAPEALR
jgi:hypothetical protein